MCGIVGAVSFHNITANLLEGLKRLEYRGYDSAGIAILNAENHIQRIRQQGKVQSLATAVSQTNIQGNIGIAHTRWATHGQPAQKNAHPHRSGHLAVVHNGIIENYQQLRTHLEECGYIFTSDTDSEVIAHLLNWKQRSSNSTLEAVQKTISQLIGAYAIVIIDESQPDTLITTRAGSPIVIGLGENENYVASDNIALQNFAAKLIYLDEGDIGLLTQNSVRIYDKEGNPVTRHIIDNDCHYEENAISKGSYRHFMEKEIFSQPHALKSTLENRLTNEDIQFTYAEIPNEAILKKIEHIQIIACGTSFNAGSIGRYWFESLAGISCDVEIASEFRYRKSVNRKNSLFITLSQSGETADTLAALKLAKNKNYLATMTICNVSGSSLVRESDYTLLTKAGIEIGVASTKAFTTQLCALLLFTTSIMKARNMLNNLESKNMIQHLQMLPQVIENALGTQNQIIEIAKEFSDKEHALFLGRGVFYPIAMEAALKLKEISYIHAESYAAGELKHGPLALVDKNMPVIVIAPNNTLFEKLRSNIEEVKARGGKLYVFSCEDAVFQDNDNLTHVILPKVPEIIAPIYYTIPMQLLAYHIALIKGTDVDQPRNLAKAVTTE